MRTSLAWHNLTHDRKRLLVAVAGVGFAVLLMLMQLGFRGALFDSTIGLLRRFDADVVVIHRQRLTLSALQRLPRRYLQLAESITGVQSAVPLYFENVRSSWKLPGKSVGPPIRVLAFDPSRPPLTMPEVRAQARLLDARDTALFDRLSKSRFGPVQIGDEVEVAGRRIRIVGEFELGTDFADDANLLVGDRTYNGLFYSHLPDGAGLDAIDFGLIRLQAGTDPEATRRALDDRLPDDALVLTKAEYLEMEAAFWAGATPIGYIFGFGTAMGFVVGTVICYQILFADVTDHLREFATLKAIGYRTRYFIGVVLEESLLLSVLGFLPGVLIGWGLYHLVTDVTGLPMNLDRLRIALVFGLTVTMCVVSGCLTMRTLISTDPAELF